MTTIITIDGPAGTGKSMVARRVAERMGFFFLDTGAMYRAVALSAIRNGVSMDDAPRLETLARAADLRFDASARPPRMLLDGEPVDHLIRTAEVSLGASAVAIVPGVRREMVERQRQVATEHAKIVSEGRDQGSVVFPDARLKVYLDADPIERARRRVKQLEAAGHRPDPKTILQQIVDRDQRDAGRKIGPLSVPQGAVVIDTTRLCEDDVVNRILQLAREAGAA